MKRILFIALSLLLLFSGVSAQNRYTGIGRTVQDITNQMYSSKFDASFSVDWYFAACAGLIDSVENSRPLVGMPQPMEKVISTNTIAQWGHFIFRSPLHFHE